jgi:hypothetical protein
MPMAGTLQLLDPGGEVALVELDPALGGQVLVVPLALLEPEADPRSVVGDGEVELTAIERRRLQFTRWLVARGRLAG